MTTLYVVDDIDARPGEAQALLRDYLERYAPGARSRGMVLERVLVSPPVWLADGSNTVTITWTLPGVPAWWHMRAQAGADAAVAAWWREADARVVRRERRFMATHEGLQELTGV